MRQISFLLTQAQVAAHTKFVTRRLSEHWMDLKPWDLLKAVHKAQGLKKGEKSKILAHIRIASLRRERLCEMTKNPAYGWEEVKKEGFPDMTPAEFVEFCCKSMHCRPETKVTRIEFEYAPDPEPDVLGMIFEMALAGKLELDSANGWTAALTESTGLTSGLVAISTNMIWRRGETADEAITALYRELKKGKQ